MAQRKSAPPGRPGSGKSGGAASNRAGTRDTPAARAAAARRAADKQTPSKASSAAGNKAASKPVDTTKPAVRAGAGRPTGRPPTRRPGKSIVNQKQTPWGLIATTVAIVLFAAAIVVVVIATKKSDPVANGGCTKMIGKNSTSYLNELTCATKIKGVTFKKEPNRSHVTGLVSYDSTPPVGGNHNAFWADCTGTVYAAAIANENAVHMLEHGAVWVTYNAKTLSGTGVDKLKTYVNGVDHTALSPYPNLKTPISLQAWGYQLFLSSPTDPRIAKFMTDFKENPLTTPEQGGICSQPTFKTNPSTFGHPTSS